MYHLLMVNVKKSGSRVLTSLPTAHDNSGCLSVIMSTGLSGLRD